MQHRDEKILSGSKPLLRSREQRIRSGGDFRRCYNGVRAGDDHLLVFAIPHEMGWSRIGVSVSRKHGNAVKRNRKKRLLREAWRTQQHDLPQSLDLIMVPRQRTDSGLDDFKASLRRLTRKLVRRLESTATGPDRTEPSS